MKEIPKTFQYQQLGQNLIHIPAVTDAAGFRNRNPLLTAGLNSIPQLDFSNAKKFASDVYRQYHQLGGQRNTDYHLDSEPHSNLAALYRLAQNLDSSVPSLFTIDANTPVQRHWVVSLALQSKEAMRNILRDINSYVSIYRVVSRIPMRYRQVSQYPLESTSWRDIVDDFRTLTTLARERNWI